jgi:hypothetical protein
MAATSASTGRPAPAPAGPRKNFRFAWTLLTKPFNKGLAVSDDFVAALGSNHLALVAMRSGQVVKQRDACVTFDDAFAFTSKNRGALVCERSVQVLSIPDLALKATFPLPGLARLAAFGKTHAAIAFEAGPVRVYEIADWSLRDEVDVGHEVRSLAVSTDGNVVGIGLDQGDVLLVDRVAGATHRMTVKMGLPVETLRFDETGARALVAAGPSVSLWDLKTRSLSQRFRSVTNVFAGGWIDKSRIASAGRDGLLVLDIASDTAKSLSGGLDGNEPAVSIAVSGDGKVLCAAERDGKLACYARGRIPARGIASATYGAEVVRMSGRAQLFDNERLTVKAHAHSNIPEPSIQVRVLRYTETTVGTVRSARWIELATARVIKVDEDMVHLQIGGALNEIPGVSDPLAYDTPLRLVWKRSKVQKKPPPVEPSSP